MDADLARVIAGMNGTDTGAGLMMGIFALPFAAIGATGVPADPTSLTPDADGTALLWYSGSPPDTLNLSVYSRFLDDWKTVTFS